MLTELRNASKGWLIVIVGAVILSMGFFGIQDVFTGRTDTALARYKNALVRPQDFDRQFQAAVQRAQIESNGAFTLTEAVATGMHREILEGLMTRATLSAQAEDLGLTASDQMLADEIQSTEAFQSPVSGEFNRQQYIELLSQNGFTPTAYEAAVREELTWRPLVDAVALGQPQPRVMAETLWARQSETRAISYFAVTPTMAGEPPEPTDEELRAFHQDNAAQFSTPEFKAVTLMIVKRSDVADQVEVDEDLLLKDYEFRQTEFQQPERRSFRRLGFDSAQAAADARAALAAGETTFEALAEARGFELSNLTQTDIAREDVIDQSIAEAVFTLADGALSEPLSGDFGWNLVEVTSVTPAQVTPFSDVRGQIEEEFFNEQADNVIFELTSTFDEERDFGAELADAADTAGLPVRVVSAIDVNGFDAEGALVTALPQGLRQGIAALAAGEETDVVTTPSGETFAARVDAVTPAALKPFEEVETQVRAAWSGDWLRGRLREIGSDVVSRTEGGEALADIAAEFGGAVATQELTAQFSDAVISPSLVNQVFNQPVGSVVRAASPAGDVMAVAEVTGVDRSEPTEDMLTLYQQSGASMINNELTEAFITTLRADADWRVNERMLNQLVPGAGN